MDTGYDQGGSASGAPRQGPSRRDTLLGALGAAVTSAAQAEAQAVDPAAADIASHAAAYGRLPAVSEVSISPDGKRVAVAANAGTGGGEIRVIDIASRTPLAVFRTSKGQTLRSVRWADDDIALGTISQTFTAAQIEAFGWRFRGSVRLLEYVRYVAMDMATKRSVLLLDKTEDSEAMSSFGMLETPIEGDPGYGRIVARASPLQDAEMAVFRVDLKTGRGVIVRRFPDETDDVLLNNAGAPIVRTGIIDAKKNTWDVRVVSGREERVLFGGSSEFGAPPGLLGQMPDGRVVLGQRGGPNETWRLIAVDLATGAQTTLFADDRYDTSRAIRDPWTRRVVGASWTDDLEPQQKFFDPALQGVYDSLRETVPDTMATIVDWTRDRSQFVVYAEAGDAGGSYFRFTPATKALDLIGRRYPGLRHIASVASITYAARDGVRVPAILTTPDRPARTPSPLVVLIHGGPGARDSGEFDWWAHFLAARGYTVLQPNFRGSTGYGHTWRSAGYGQWGGLMSRDVEDGARVLIRSGRIDPKRIAFVGASYGAYAALTAAMQTPDLVCCAAGVGGVYDLPRLVAAMMGGAERNGVAADFFTTTIGALKTDKPALIAASPTLNAARITAPVLLMHGTEDSVVDISQTNGLRNALTAAGKPPSFVALKGDDHWLSDGATRTQMLTELGTFLARHLA